MYVATPLEEIRRNTQAKTPSKNTPLIKGEGEYAAKPRQQGGCVSPGRNMKPRLRRRNTSNWENRPE